MRPALRARQAGLTMLAVGALAVSGLAVGTGAAFTSSSSATVRLAGLDRFGTAAAVSAATFPSGAAVAYLATGYDFTDALAAAAAAGGKAPVLLAGTHVLPHVTAVELGRLHPARVIVVGGTSSVGDTTMAAARKAASASSSVRLAGLRRFDTAAAVSQSTFPNGASVAYIATDRDYPDALAAAAAASGHGPVLLTEPGTLPKSTAQELQRLDPATVYVVGGTSAVSDAALMQIRSVLPDTSLGRVFGPDRFSTAAALSRLTYPTGARHAYVATGFDFPDALSAAVAASGNGPVLLVGDPPYANPAFAELQRIGASALTVVGGVDAVGSDLVSKLTAVLSAPTPAVSSRASLVVATAKAQIGKAYQWGGAGPDSFDCSGLVMVAWAAAGVTLPHNAEAQAEMVAPVAITDLQPGDIVFYGTPGNVYHDGLYIGDGQMVEAAHSGVPVRISPIDRPDLLIGGRPAPNNSVSNQ